MLDCWRIMFDRTQCAVQVGQLPAELQRFHGRSRIPPGRIVLPWRYRLIRLRGPTQQRGPAANRMAIPLRQEQRRGTLSKNRHRNNKGNGRRDNSHKSNHAVLIGRIRAKV